MGEQEPRPNIGPNTAFTWVVLTALVAIGALYAGYLLNSTPQILTREHHTTSTIISWREYTYTVANTTYERMTTLTLYTDTHIYNATKTEYLTSWRVGTAINHTDIIRDFLNNVESQKNFTGNIIIGLGEITASNITFAYADNALVHFDYLEAKAMPNDTWLVEAHNLTYTYQEEGRTIIIEIPTVTVKII